METLFENIGGLFIIAVILIVKVLFRKAEAAEEETEDPVQDAYDTDLPAEMHGGGMRPDVRPDMVPAKTARARMTMQKHTNARKSELQAKRTRQQTAKAAASSSNMAAKYQPTPVSQPASAAPQPTADGNVWMDGFDLRRAVVWSEILRPKFEEDEA